jgi:(p)ppGpp synthase/HD superfamily hydrolase
MKCWWSQDLYIKAYQYAAKAHNGQLLPGSELPYIVHLSFVSMEIMAALTEDYRKLDGNLAIQCALLHDTMEDAGISYYEICDVFGQRVADGVNALSKRSMFATQKEKMIDSLVRIKTQPIEVWMVKLADRITNLMPPPAYWNEEKIENYREEAKLIYGELKDASEYLAFRLYMKIERYPLRIPGS